ncbi:MAG: hypothetical protein ACRCZF_10675, partial [Gemmataceae bacterium]
MHQTLRLLLLGVGFFGATIFVAAQAPPKRPLKHSDYEIWNTATGMTLSRDGHWIAYVLNPPEGDATVIIKNLMGSQEYKFAKGGRPAAPPAAPGAAPTEPSTPTISLGGSPQFTPDGKKVLIALTPTKAELEQAKAEKKKPEEQPRATVAVIELATGKIIERIEKIRDYTV